MEQAKPYLTPNEVAALLIDPAELRDKVEAALRKCAGRARPADPAP